MFWRSSLKDEDTVREKTAFSARFEKYIYAIEVLNTIIYLCEKINLFTHADTKFFILIIYVNLGIKNCNNDFNQFLHCQCIRICM